MKQIFAECFGNEMHIAEMKSAFAKLKFSSFEVRTLGVFRISAIFLSGFLTALASIQSNSPIPLFLLLAIIVQSFAGSLFPRYGTTLNLANPSFALPLLTVAALLHFGASFLWPIYREGLGAKMVVWFCIFVTSLMFIQFAYSTLRVRLQRNATLDKIRWIYAVFSLVIIIIDLAVSRAAKFSNEVHELLAPSLQYTEAFLKIDYVLFGGFVVLILAEGTYQWSKSSIAWRQKPDHPEFSYRKDDVDESFLKSIPRDAQLRLVDLAKWICWQVENFWRFVCGVLAELWTLVCKVWASFICYGKTSLSACLLFVVHLLPLILVGLALLLAYMSANNISTREGEYFALRFYGYLFGSAIVLLIAYCAHYYPFFKVVARHFRHSFLGFVHLCILVCMCIGIFIWNQFDTKFAPGYALYVAVVVYLALIASIFFNWSEIGYNKKPPGVNHTDGATQEHHQDGAHNTVGSDSYNPSYWLFSLMIVLTASVALKQWPDDPKIKMIKEFIEITMSANRITVAEPQAKKETKEKAEIGDGARLDAEVARKAEEVRVRRVAEEVRKSEEVRARRVAEEVRKSEEVRVRREAEEVRKTEEVRVRREAEEKAKAEATRKAEEAKRLPSCPGSYVTAAWTNCVGEMTFTNGQKYVGEFRGSKRYGQGTYMWPDGGKYVGEFRDGARYGHGTQYLADGRILQSGSWENDVFVRSR